MSDLYPLRVYLASDGSYGIAHVHDKGAEVIARSLSYEEACSVIEQAMLSYPNTSNVDTFQVKKDVNDIASTLYITQPSF